MADEELRQAAIRELAKRELTRRRTAGSPFTPSNVATMGLTAASAPLNPIALPQLFGQAIRHAPARTLEPAFTTAGAVGGGLTPIGPVAGAGFGGAVGRGIEAIRENPQISAGELLRESGLAGLRDAAGTYVLGGIAKGATGGSMKFLQRVSPPLATSPLARIGASGVGGAVAGAASMPQHPFIGATVGGVTGAGGQGIFEGIGQVPSIAQGEKTLFSRKRLASLSKRGEQDLILTKQGAGPALETELSQLKQPVNLRSKIEHLQSQRSNPVFNDAIQSSMDKAAELGDTTLQQFFNNPELAEVATPLQAQQVVNTLEQSPTTYRLVLQSRSPNYPFSQSAGGQFLQRANEFDLQFLRHAQSIRDVLHSEVPGYTPTIEKFADTMQSVPKLKTLFSERSGEKNIKGGFSGRTEERLTRTLPSQTVQQIQNVQKARTANRITAALGLLTGGGAGVLKFLQRTKE